MRGQEFPGQRGEIFGAQKPLNHRISRRQRPAQTIGDIVAIDGKAAPGLGRVAGGHAIRQHPRGQPGAETGDQISMRGQGDPP